jgi:membrane protease subunit HflC
MKNRNAISLVTGFVLALIFALMMFAFQVRQTDIVVVTTFGKYSRSITDPGLYWRMPWPIQKIHRFDNRTQNFERVFEQTSTKDAINILITVFSGWKVVKPQLYLESLNGDKLKAEAALEPMIRNAKNAIIGQRLFSEIISTSESGTKFDFIEESILSQIGEKSLDSYGIEVSFVRIKQLGLPESITTKVMDRMRAERETRVKQFQAEGEKEARIIRSIADNEASKILSEANARAIEITGQAEAEASKYYKVLERNPDLAIFNFRRNALETSLKKRTTLVLDSQTTPFNLFKSIGTNDTFSIAAEPEN